MKKLNITGYGDDLTVNDCRIGDLSPQEHQDIELNRRERLINHIKNIEQDTDKLKYLVIQLKKVMGFGNCVFKNLAC